MATNLHPPDELNFDADDLKTEFQRFKKDLKIFILATDKKAKSSEVKASILLNVIGRRGRQIYDNFTFVDDVQSLDYESVLTHFEEYCSPKTSESFARYKFFTNRQNDGQNFDKYLTELHTLANECNFDNLRDSLLRDMIVIGTKDCKVQEKLLRETNLDLKKATQIAKTSEITNKYAAEMKNKNVVDEMYKPKGEQPYRPQHSTSSYSKPKFNRRDSYQPETITDCKFCTYNHVRGKCPAYNKQCKRCGKLNHFAKACPSKRINNIEENYSANEMSSDDNNDEDIDTLYIGAIENEDKTNIWTTILNLNDTEIELKLDTGAETNVLPMFIYKTLTKKAKLHKTTTKLKAYNGSDIKVVGKCILFCYQDNRKIPIQFIVVDEKRKPILGLATCVNLNLIKRTSDEHNIHSVTHEMVNKHKDVLVK